MSGHKVKEEDLVRLELEGELLKEFETIKKHFGLKVNENVLRKLIDVAYEDLVARGVKFS